MEDSSREKLAAIIARVAKGTDVCAAVLFDFEEQRTLISLNDGEKHGTQANIN